MASVFGRRTNFNLNALSDFSHLEGPVQTHLKNVYSCLCITMLAAAAGAYLHLAFGFAMFGGFIGAIVGIGMMLWLVSVPHTPKNLTKRLGIMSGFGLLTGLSMGPLLNMVLHVNPQIITTAFLGTTVIFGGFSLAALFNKNRAYLFMGGTLISALLGFSLLSLVNIFIGSKLLFDIYIYGTLFVICGFVMFDTQMIIEKRRRGDDDYIWHSVDLFLDFIQIFQRLLIILTNKEDKKKRRN